MCFCWKTLGKNLSGIAPAAVGFIPVVGGFASGIIANAQGNKAGATPNAPADVAPGGGGGFAGAVGRITNTAVEAAKAAAAREAQGLNGSIQAKLAPRDPPPMPMTTKLLIGGAVLALVLVLVTRK